MSAYSEMREKVVRALAATTVFPNESSRWEREADAAILAVLDALIEMDLPEEAVLAAVVADTDAEIFRATLTALKPSLTEESGQ